MTAPVVITTPVVLTATVFQSHRVLHASPAKPNSDVDSNRYYYQKYPPLTPGEILTTLVVPLSSVYQFFVSHSATQQF